MKNVTAELAVRELARRRCEGSLHAFMTSAWRIVEPSTEFIDGWHLHAICDHLEAVSRGEIRNLVINIPPRHCKSLLTCVFWPVWEWATKPQTRWLFASYAQTLSIRDSLKCRRILESAWFKGLWGNRCQLVSDQNQKARFENSQTGYRVATSVGGSATGEGGDRVVVDDPHKVGDVPSERLRENVIHWWNEEMSTRGNDPRTVARVIVGQRVHETDLCGYVLEQGGYEHLCLAAEFDGHRSKTSIGWKDPRKDDGELLWTERFGNAEIDELKSRLGSYGAASQLQQRPSPAGGGMISDSWWKFYDTEPFCDEVIQSWDMAFKGGKKGSFVVGQTWGRKGPDFFLLDQVRKRMTFPETIQAVRGLYLKWGKTTAILVEDKANGPAIIDTLKSDIPGIIPVNPEGSKLARAAAVSALIESGNVHLPSPQGWPWVHEFLQEASSFPVGATDDQVDAMTQALSRLRTSTQIGMFPIRARLLRKDAGHGF